MNMNMIIANNIIEILKKQGKKQTDLVDALQTNKKIIEERYAVQGITYSKRLQIKRRRFSLLPLINLEKYKYYKKDEYTRK